MCSIYFFFLFVNEIFKVKSLKRWNIWELWVLCHQTLRCAVQLWIKEIKPQWMTEHIEELAEQITAEWIEHFMGHGQNWDEKEIGGKVKYLQYLAFKISHLWAVLSHTDAFRNRHLPFMPIYSFFSPSNQLLHTFWTEDSAAFSTLWCVLWQFSLIKYNPIKRRHYQVWKGTSGLGLKSL